MKKNKSYSWQKEAETYFNWTPHPKAWFEFLGWITAFSTLNFLSQKTDSIYIKLIFYFSLFVLYNYFSKMFWTKKFQKYLPERFPELLRKLLTIGVSAICVAASYLLFNRIAEDIIKGLKL